MYGFHKIPHIDDNAFSKTESQIWEFSNPNFHRDQPDLLCLVTRKKSGEAGDKDSIDFQTIMSEINAIKRHQMTISEELKRVQKVNLDLWQEQMDTRSRHSKHQETIDKILAFLGSVYGNQRHDEKIIRPKKRKLLLQQDSSDQIEAADSVFDDEKTKETFDEMFKSASTSPILRPLRQPNAEIASSNFQTTNGTERRFTMPHYDNHHQNTSAPVRPQQNRHMQNIKESSSAAASPLASLKPVDSSLGEDILFPGSTTSQAPPAAAGLPPKQVSPNTTSMMPLDPSQMQLTPSVENRISSNNHRAGELEQDLALQDDKIRALAESMGLDLSDLDNIALDPEGLPLDPGDPRFAEGLQDIDYSNFNPFDDFLNTNLVTATPQSDIENGFPLNGTISHENGSARYDMHPTSSATVPPDRAGSANNSVSGSTPGARIVSAGSTPSPTSLTGSLLNEQVEEIDMDKARGKKRQKNN